MSGITACILARNEETRIEDALRSLQGWTEQIVVLDNESEDRTVEIARAYTPHVLTAPRAANFDAARNLAINVATGDWLFYLDADERVPPRLGPELLRLVREQGEQFEALVLPFKHYFCGKWMQHSGWWPGYTRPQLLKKGRFRYNERLHSGVEVDGRTALFPADDPELALVHYSYADLHHYLAKLNRYTDGEAENLLADGKCHAWQAMLAHFVHDWQVYYDRNQASQDGLHGFILSFLSAFYRFASRAKLWDQRRLAERAAAPGMAVGLDEERLTMAADPVPADLREALEFMARVVQEGAEPWISRAHVGKPPEAQPAAVSERLASLEATVDEPLSFAGEPLPAITAILLARNEERRLLDALRSLQGWVSQILVLDHGSTDGTAGVAERFGATVIPVPYERVPGTGDSERGQNFDGLRSLALPHVTGDWVLILDADERIPPRLSQEYLRLIRECPEEFSAVVPPFRNHFCGRWMRYAGWFPCYLHVQLLKRGKFTFGERIHGGIQVDGPQHHLPPDPELAVIHESYEDLHQYLEKLNRYTDAEAESLRAEGVSHCWQSQLAHFTHEWHLYYEEGQGVRDGLHGFVLAFMSAFYRFAARAKLWDLRRQHGELRDGEPVPRDLREMLQFMAQVLQEGPGDWLTLRHREEPRSALPRNADAPASALNGSAASARRIAPPPAYPLVWRGPLLDPSGYAHEGRHFVLGLCEAGEPLLLQPQCWGDREVAIPALLTEALAQGEPDPSAPIDVFVSHTLPGLQEPSPLARCNVARTMFETDRLPGPFVQNLNRFDRIWVPSEFNCETFIRSGVDPDKLAVVPGTLDPEPFHRAVKPWPLPQSAEGPPPFRFLSVFDWTLHKGWDVLIEAFAREFGSGGPEAPAPELWIKTWSSNHYTPEDLRGQADAHLRSTVGRGLEAFPNLRLWQETIPEAALPRLYRAFDAFVLPTRGEGWCRPLMEAMASGLPTIATGWSGLTAFHNAEVGYPLPYRLRPVPEAGAREIPLYAGHCWAEPSCEELQRLLRHLVEHPEEGRAKGQAAQAHVTTHFSRAAVTPQLVAELERCRKLAASRRQPQPASARPAGANGSVNGHAAPTPNGNGHVTTPAPAVRFGELRKPKANPVPRDPVAPIDFRTRLGRPLRVRWEGDFALRSSLGLVNREFCLALLAAGDVELSLGEHTTPWHGLTEADDPRFGPLFALRGGDFSGPPDVTIRHHFPPSWSRPEHGKLVVIQPWEYGHLPQDWVRGAQGADEVWAYSRFVREVYARSGVPAERVRVVPLGYRPEIFQPEGPQYPLQTEKTHRFLFVGGALDRKGADLLLQAYLRAFRREDDVCLVVKDMGTRTFYQGQTFGEAFRQAQADPHAPEIHYLDADLSDLELAALYRACTAVVLPYRGEGFGLSPLEGMACGRPVIVTAGGPTDDYATDETGLRVPQRKRYTGMAQLGPFPCTGDPWQLEPELDALVDALRWVRDHPDEARQRGAAACEQAAAWTWSSAAAELRGRLAELILPTRERAASSPQPWTGAKDTATAADCGAKTQSPPPKRFRPPSGQKNQDRPLAPGGVSQSSTTPSTSPNSLSPNSVSPSGTRERVRGASISLCMIARDEEPRIGDCLRSIAPYVDELIVVDTGSTDRTREIAAECGARVYDLPWPDSFAAARNASIELATSDWIFWMDADDVISPECGAGLRELVRRHPQRDAAYHVAVHIPPGPGEFSPSVVDHVKLFPNRPDLRFEHRIHEQILPALRRAGLDVRFSDLYVTHQNYDRSDAGQAKKRRRDYHLLELDLQDRPDHPFVLFNLGMTYLYATKEYELAAHYLRRSLDHSHPADSIVRKAYAMLGTARICQGEWEAAIQANEEGRSHYPHDAELLFQAGQVYQQLGHFDAARRCLEQLTEGEEDEHYRSVDVGLRTYRGRHELALLFRRMGDAPHCEAVLREIAALQPSYLTAQVDLAETILLQGRKGEARQLLERIPSVKGVQEDLERLRVALGTPGSPR